MSKAHNRLRRFCAWILGVVFVMSGILKLQDPVGTGLTVVEYLKFLHVGFLSPAALPFGVALALVEALTGVLLVTGVWRKVGAASAGVLMVIFTILTAVLAIFKPEMDCGCFGEAIHLTHLQTFLKNVVLDALALVAFLPFRDFGEPRKVKYGCFGIVTLSIVAMSVYALMYLPPKDFTDYRPGASLSQAPEMVEFSDVYVYEKDGVQESFDLENLPDSSWTFVGVEQSSAVDAGPCLPVSHFGQTADSLALAENLMVVSIYRPARLGDSDLEKIAAFEQRARQAGYQTLRLSLDPDEEYTSDYRSLVGLNRSNGGVTLLSEGMVIRKWALRGLPSRERLEEISGRDATEMLIDGQTRGDMMAQAFLLYIFTVLILL